MLFVCPPALSVFLLKLSNFFIKVSGFCEKIASGQHHKHSNQLLSFPLLKFLIHDIETVMPVILLLKETIKIVPVSFLNFLQNFFRFQTRQPS